MNLPTIDVHSLPDFDGATALFGSLPTAAGGDTTVAIMIYIFDHLALDMLL